MPTVDRLICTVAAFWMTAVPCLAQTAEAEATETSSAVPAEALLTAEELQKLVAPVALYPDTVLIQVLIAAAAPLDVIMADRLLKDNPDTPPAELEALIKSKKFDLSVEVLAIAFPRLINEMSVHIDWTETIGNAMLVQSEDVMAAVQVMRSQAINTGALIDSPEVTVSTSSDTNEIVVQPTNPSVVYVPQYDPVEVYSNPVGDAIVTGLVIFGTAALIDEIFDDDDDWNDYWGCRNCADWNHGTVIRNPDIDIDFDGNVNIGNQINIGNDIDRDVIGRWQASDKRKAAATNVIASRRNAAGGAISGIERPKNRASELRSQLGSRADVGNIDGQGKFAGKRDRVAGDRSSGGARAALTERTKKSPNVKAPKSFQKPAAKPKISGANKRSSAKPKIAATGTGSSAKAASLRGKASQKRRK